MCCVLCVTIVIFASVVLVLCVTVVIFASVVLVFEQWFELSRQRVDLKAVQKPALSLVALALNLHATAQNRLQLAELQRQQTGQVKLNCR